ncbi:hypothetical protein QAD02_012636 [Eretmocerus hayati]|uniref:Uncharacterized protein n=1 Tax=Eretmocerus hayati TaxID=131215 RepID=A0ACC2P2U5_9HYME|nr:hypothetical protein QAD02_012636 [Eretmocerus hayati]
MSDAEDNSGDTPKTRQGTKYARKEFVHDQRELVRKNLGEQFGDEFNLGNLLSEDIETVEVTKDKSDDDSNDKTDNGNDQSGSGETQTQKVDSTLKKEITSQIESSVKSLGDSLLTQLKDTFAEQFRSALAGKSLPNIDNQTSGVVVNQPNKIGKRRTRKRQWAIAADVQYHYGTRDGPGYSDWLKRYKEEKNYVYIGEGKIIDANEWRLIKEMKDHREALRMIDLIVWENDDFANCCIEPEKAYNLIPGRGPVQQLDYDKMRHAISIYKDVIYTLIAEEKRMSDAELNAWLLDAPVTIARHARRLREELIRTANNEATAEEEIERNNDDENAINPQSS